MGKFLDALLAEFPKQHPKDGRKSKRNPQGTPKGIQGGPSKGILVGTPKVVSDAFFPVDILAKLREEIQMDS